MKRRVLTIALAVALAVLGTVAVLVYVNQADARAVAGQQAVTVLVANETIPSGTKASDAMSSLRKETLPASSVSSDAVAEITADQDSLVTSTNLSSGQLLLKSMLVPAEQASGALAIPKGKVAVTITLCKAEMVAGNVRVGSQVTVFGTVVAGGNSEPTAQPNCTGQHKQQVSGKGIGNTRVVIPKVQVLAIGPAPSATSEDDSKTNNAAVGSSTQNDMTLVTFAVNQDDAERLILLTQTGLPSLAVHGPDAEIKPDDHIVPQFPAPAKK
jgi:pilus assembly protein CpaB